MRGLRYALTVKRFSHGLFVSVHRRIRRGFDREAALTSDIIALDEIGNRGVIIVGHGRIHRATQLLPGLVPVPVVDFVGRQTRDQRQFTCPFFDLFTVSLAEAGIVIENLANSIRGLIREVHMA